MKIFVAITALLLLAPQNQDELPVPKGVELKTWKNLGLENRWVTFRHSVDTEKGLIQNWLRFLDARDDFELLELIAIYGGYQAIFQKGNPGEVLYRRDAPQWMRVALWNLRQRDTHSVEAATGPLDKHPGRFMGWAKKFRAVKRLNGAKLMKKHEGAAPVDPGDQLPPLDPQTVILPFLDAPRQLPTLTPAGVFDKGKRYRFQVLRAIRAVSVAGQFAEPYRGKLMRLTRHADPVVRRAAMLEFSEFPSASIPFSELLTMAGKKDLLAEDRKAALLAASYSNHPEVYLQLHAVLLDPEHPGFDAVVQRMYAQGGGYTLEIIHKLSPDGIPKTRRASIDRLAQTLAKRPKNVGTTAGLLLHRASWATFKGDAQAEALVTWTRAHMRLRLSKPEFRASVRKFVQSLESGAIPKSLHGWIRAEAKRILDPK